MGKFEKLIKKIYSRPVPVDITYQEAARLLISVGCTMRKRGGSHRVFTYPGYPYVIVLMESENLKQYQVLDIRKLLEHIGLTRPS
ncbi:MULTISPECIES: type II toxin-antitoxin system HicA family toxin [Desulfofundulus]|uniref:HicA toxin of toxin-antitoxin n=1 Tax=Desulfofundulus thermosubterraneus DSM 16057 TaxID=1121432 RepID=A0A1M6HAN2_9FIRM|nr:MULTISPECIES: type II toxin-antitoxin system HicA family toxin [Desulfofundulus]NHM26040.1 type II toxin-antitoxin system HicA family toxin [Desulfofundulus sp. TPOSR]SHJ19291.1 HicA toxin of toxin-antitoxin [Desulfofundulus thermosubterraneus DSM 16057]